MESVSCSDGVQIFSGLCGSYAGLEAANDPWGVIAPVLERVVALDELLIEQRDPKGWSKE